MSGTEIAAGIIDDFYQYSSSEIECSIWVMTITA